MSFEPQLFNLRVEKRLLRIGRYKKFAKMILFDLADNESYRQYSRRLAEAVGKHGGSVVTFGRLDGVQSGDPDVVPRTVMILVEWPSRQAFGAFLDDPEHADLHSLREGGTHNYLWWLYERLDDLRPLFGAGRRRE